MAAKIFIDGEAGTTGLQLRDRLTGRRDFEILSIAPDKRKDPHERKRLLNAASARIRMSANASSTPLMWRSSACLTRRQRKA